MTRKMHSKIAHYVSAQDEEGLPDDERSIRHSDADCMKKCVLPKSLANAYACM